MRKIAFILSLFLGIVLLANGQGVLVSASPNPIPSGYSGNLVITGAGTNFSHATCGINLRLTHVGTGTQYNFGTAPTGAGWMPGNPWPTDLLAEGNISIPLNAPAGYYDVDLTGFEGDQCFFNVTNVSAAGLIYIGAAGTVEGEIVHDLDSNCARNGMDAGLANQILTFTPGPFYAVTDANGAYSVRLVPGTYTVSVPAQPGSVFVCPVSPNTHTVTLNTPQDTVSGVNFYVKGDHTVDMRAFVTNSIHRPGFNNCYAYLVVQNNSFGSADSVLAKLIKPSIFTFDSFDVQPDIISGDTAIWNLGTVPGNSGSYYFTARMGVPANTALGTYFSYQGWVTSGNFDSNTYNNHSYINDFVRGSYDPNDKQVWTENGVNADGLILTTDTLLRYLIRFQNTGTDTAFNIAIADNIDPDLDISSLEVEAASGDYQIQFLDTTGRHLKFLFPNILLPDSNTNESASHGFIQYTMRRSPALAQGTTIDNGAGIYFDFNSPVMTNLVRSKICNALGVNFASTATGLQVDFMAPAAGNPTLWQWDFGDGGTSNIAQPSHTYASNGVYNVCLRIGNGCGRLDTLCANVYVGVTGVGATTNALQSLTLSPNPAQNDVELEVVADRLRNAEFTLRDLQGKVVDHWNVNAIFGKYVKQLSVAHLAPGLYFLTLQSLETQYTVKLMVE